MSGRSALVLHPILFAVYPVLALLAANLQEISPDQALRSLLIVPIAALLLLGLLVLCVRDWHGAGLAATAVLLMASSYGHLYGLLDHVQVAGVVLGRHRYLIPLAVMALTALLIWIWKARPDLRSTTRLLNLVGSFAVAITLLSIGTTLYRVRSDSSDPLSSVMLQTRLNPPPDAPLPDVYYIILDGYARSDYMQSVFGYDNSEFIAFLESRGFYVARDSHTNHNWTALSLASSLNMTYAQDLGLRLVRGNYPGVFLGRIRHSIVRDNFESMGYETVGYRSGYIPTEWTDADRFMLPDEMDIESVLSLNTFEGILFQSSIGRIVTDLGGQKARSWTATRESQPYDLLREIVLYELDTLPELAGSPGPKFVFAHIVSPHSPYLFDATGVALEQSQAFTLVEPGEEGPASDPRRLYADQATFITSKIETSIDGILARSATPPIIIIQADHGPHALGGVSEDDGPGLRLRMSILNAYLVPKTCRPGLYPSITPVNTFRIVFNCAFGAGYPMLQDNSYYGPKPTSNDYSFTLVNDRLD
jgi:hypothetical protein